jgi:hypothetical protein
VGNDLADHEAITSQQDEANFQWRQHTPRASASQRNRIIRDSSSSGTVPRSAAYGNTSPCWIGREVILAADQGFPKFSCAHHGCSMNTEWIGNEKSASWRTATDQYRICLTPQDLVTLK